MAVAREIRFSSIPLLRVLVIFTLAFFPCLRAATATSATVSPLGSPTSPTEEEEEKSGNHKSAAESAAPARGGRKASGAASSRAGFGARNPLTGGHSLTRAAPLDPFRNGLGSPIRC